MKLTEHFTAEELTTTSVNSLELDNFKQGISDITKLEKLAEFAEKVRSVLCCPMIITSGYRSAELNKIIGGSPTSQHTNYGAIDFIPTKISALDAFCSIALSNFSFGQLILEKRGLGYILHISMGNSRKTLYSANLGHYEQVTVVPAYK